MAQYLPDSIKRARPTLEQVLVCRRVDSSYPTKSLDESSIPSKLYGKQPKSVRVCVEEDITAALAGQKEDRAFVEHKVELEGTMEEEEVQMLSAILGQEAVTWIQGSSGLSVSLTSGAVLHFTAPDGYPDVPAAVKLSDPSLEATALPRLLASEAESLAGTPMVYQLVRFAQDWLDENGDRSSLDKDSPSTLVEKQSNEKKKPEGFSRTESDVNCLSTTSPSKTSRGGSPAKTTKKSHVSKSRTDSGASSSKPTEAQVLQLPPKTRTVDVDVSPPRDSQSDPRTKMCPFFLSGKCRFGDRCHNLHSRQAPAKPKAPSEQSLHDEMKSRDSRQESLSPSRKSPSKVSEHAKDEVDGKVESTATVAGGKKPMKQAIHVIHRILWDDQLQSERFKVGYLDRFVGIIEKPFAAFSWEDLSTAAHDVLAIPQHRIQYFKYKDVIVWDKQTQVDEVFGSRGSSRTILEVMKEVDGEEGAGKAAEGQKTSNSSERLSDSDLDPEDIDESSQKSKMSIYRAKADKNRPTHFIYIPVFGSKEIVAKAKELQDHVTERDPRFEDGRLPLENLHVSVGYVRLEREDDCRRATQVLKEIQPVFASLLPPCQTIHSKGVDTFRDRLIFAKVNNFPALGRFVQLLLKKFQEAGISTPGNHEPYVPHITLLRLRRPMMREMDQAIIPKWLYQPFEGVTFGTQPIQDLSIGEMAHFYVRYRFAISNCALNLSPLVAPGVLSTANMLCRFGVITESVLQEVQDVIEAYNSGEDQEKCVKAEKAVENIRKHTKRILEGKNKFLSLSDMQSMSETVVVILRGLPGSGKSWVANHCLEMREDPSSVAICSADSFFQQGDLYCFDANLLSQAHQHCLTEFLKSLSERKRFVIVDNTNIHLWEYFIYKYLCQLFGIQHFVLEVPCWSEAVAKTFASRNQHFVPPASVLKMYSSWEEDKSAIALPPSIVNSYQPTSPWSYSMSALCNGDSQLLGSVQSHGYPVSVVYSGVYLEPHSKQVVLSAVAPTHPTLYVDHVTLVFQPTVSQAGGIPLGKVVEFTPLGWASNNEVQALAVQLPPGIHSANAKPHVTISTEVGVSPKYSNDLLQSDPALHTPFPQSVRLKGRVGMVVAIAPSDTTDARFAGKSFHVFSSEDFQSILPYVRDHHNPLSTPALPLSSGASALLPKPPPASGEGEAPSILPGPQPVTKLFVFDFDGTLFNTPGPEDGRVLYEKLTGKKWPHEKGWVRWPESLLPPLATPPGSALQHFHTHSGQSGSLTVLLTGRMPETSNAVLEILHQHAVCPQLHFFKDTPFQRESAAAYKVRIIEQLLKDYPNIRYVKVFDDREDNLDALRKYAKQSTNVEFDLVDANVLQVENDRLQPKCDSVVESFLYESGRLALPSHHQTAEAGIEFICTQWASLVQFKGPPTNLVVPYGSYPLGRLGDVDLCLVAPPSLSHFECVDLLASRMEVCGTVYVHRGYSSRCPCVKLLMQFASLPSVKFDIVFLVVQEKEFFEQLKDCKPSLSALKAQVVPGDLASKASIAGPVFLQHVLSRIKNQLSVREFGMAVEMAAWLIKSQRLKGNALSCMRTFHVVQVMSDLVHTAKDEVLSLTSSKVDWLFCTFISKSVLISASKWEQLFEGFVPSVYVPKLQAALEHAQICLCDRFKGQISRECLISLLQRPSFPSANFRSVFIKFESDDAKLEWQLETILEARIPTYVHQLITHGLDIQPSGNDLACGCVMFAVQHRAGWMDTVNAVMKPLWSELETYRKNPNVTINLGFCRQLSEVVLRSRGCSAVQTSSDGDILQQVNDFAARSGTPTGEGGVPELHLPLSLSSYQRMLVHKLAEELGLKHVSVGSGQKRHLLLSYKTP